jgi:hypothetical protein
MKEQLQKLIDEDETLRFHCDNCKKEWVETRPTNTWIRSGNGTNYYIPMMHEEGPHIPIICKKCGKTDKIRRVPPPMHTYASYSMRDTRAAMMKWATTPITREQELGDEL